MLKALEPIWNVKPETASRVRRRMEAVLSWAKVRGYRQGENPALWRGHLDHLLPATSKVRPLKHHAAMPYREIGTLMASLRADSCTSARAIEFMILTATRRGETFGARWEEIDLDQRIWTVPAPRMLKDMGKLRPASRAASGHPASSRNPPGPRQAHRDGPSPRLRMGSR